MLFRLKCQAWNGQTEFELENSLEKSSVFKPPDISSDTSDWIYQILCKT